MEVVARPKAASHPLTDLALKAHLTERLLSSDGDTAWNDRHGRRADLRVTTLVSIVHSVAMITAGGHAAWMVYRYLGLKLVSQRWFNLDAIRAFSLILVGALSLSIGMAGWH